MNRDTDHSFKEAVNEQFYRHNAPLALIEARNEEQQPRTTNAIKDCMWETRSTLLVDRGFRGAVPR
jgi:hypothetical protein